MAPAAFRSNTHHSTHVRHICAGPTVFRPEHARTRPTWGAPVLALAKLVEFAKPAASAEPRLPSCSALPALACVPGNSRAPTMGATAHCRVCFDGTAAAKHERSADENRTRGARPARLGASNEPRPSARASSVARSASGEVRRRSLFAFGADLFGREQLLRRKRQLLGRGAEPSGDLLDSLTGIFGDVATELRGQCLELLGRTLFAFRPRSNPDCTSPRTRSCARCRPRWSGATPHQRSLDRTPNFLGDCGGQILDETINDGTNGLVVHEAREAIMSVVAAEQLVGPFTPPDSQSRAPPSPSTPSPAWSRAGRNERLYALNARRSSGSEGSPNTRQTASPTPEQHSRSPFGHSAEPYRAAVSAGADSGHEANARRTRLRRSSSSNGERTRVTKDAVSENLDSDSRHPPFAGEPTSRTLPSRAPDSAARNGHGERGYEPLDSAKARSSPRTIAGRMDPDGPRSEQCAFAVSGVRCGFTSTTNAPCSRATKGSSAAGYTTVEVPIDKKTSARRARSRARSSASAGRAS